MRILLVKKDSDLGAALKRTLNQQGYVVDWVTNGLWAWDYLENPRIHYTLAVFDWILPGLPGVELCYRLRQQDNSLLVLMLTASEQMDARIMGLDAGADDCLSEPFGIAELLARLRALKRRLPILEEAAKLQVGNLTLDSGTHSVTQLALDGKTQTLPLSRKEFQLLECFMRHPNQIVSQRQIMNYLWEIDTDYPSSNAVAAQIRLLRRKLGSVLTNSSIETVYGIGYRLNINQVFVIQHSATARTQP